MARASSRLTSVQINTTKQFLLWGCSVFTALQGAHICLNMRICVHTPCRLQWIVIDCETRYCTKKSVHIFQVSPHIKFGCTPVRLTWEDHLSSLFHCEEFDELTNITGLPVLVCCTFNELRGSLWLSDLVFPGLSDALGPSDNENLFTVLISILPHHVFEYFSKGALRTCHEFSTSVRWLSYVDIAWLVGLRHGSPRTCLSSLSDSIDAGSGIEPSISCVDVGGVGVDKLDNEDVVDEPGTMLATCLW